VTHAAPISSIHNPRVAAALGLRASRERRIRGLLLIDGAREIDRAASAGVVFRELFVAQELLDHAGADGRRALHAATLAGGSVVSLTTELMGRMAFGDRTDGLLAVAVAPDVSLDQLTLPEEPLVGVVEAVEKPGNLGALLRSADGAGVDAVVVADPACDPWNPNAIRASLGTVFSVPLAISDAATVRAWLAEAAIRTVITLVDAPVAYTAADLTGAVAIVLGSEAEGLTPTWREGSTAVHIPMHGVADSLNVSASAAILFYEALRQRGARVSRPGPAGAAAARPRR
jgi:TrmH family RNA methyltransferase